MKKALVSSLVALICFAVLVGCAEKSDGKIYPPLGRGSIDGVVEKLEQKGFSFRKSRHKDGGADIQYSGALQNFNQKTSCDIYIDAKNSGEVLRVSINTFDYGDTRNPEAEFQYFKDVLQIVGDELFLGIGVNNIVDWTRKTRNDKSDEKYAREKFSGFEFFYIYSETDSGTSGSLSMSGKAVEKAKRGFYEYAPWCPDFGAVTKSKQIEKYVSYNSDGMIYKYAMSMENIDEYGKRLEELGFEKNPYSTGTKTLYTREKQYVYITCNSEDNTLDIYVKEE